MKKLSLLIIAFLFCLPAVTYAGKCCNRSYRSRPPVVHNNTTIIHHDSGSSLAPFMFGYMMGHTGPSQPQTVIVQPPAAQAAPQPQAPAPAPAAVPVQAAIPQEAVAEEDQPMSLFQRFMVLCLVVLTASVAFHLVRKKPI